MKLMKYIIIATLSFGIVTGISAQENEFEVWDSNQDGVINNEEFEAGLEEDGLFQTYDYNEDEVWDDEEWSAVTLENDYLEDEYYEDWDVDEDGYVYEDEFYEGAYDLWDKDDDDQIDLDEYRANPVWTR